MNKQGRIQTFTDELVAEQAATEPQPNDGLVYIGGHWIPKQRVLMQGPLNNRKTRRHLVKPPEEEDE